MLIDERFNKRAARLLADCWVSAAMNLLSAGPATEAERVRVRFSHDTEDGETVTLRIRMSRDEARNLGNHLVRYGSTVLEGEDPASRRSPAQRLLAAARLAVMQLHEAGELDVLTVADDVEDILNGAIAAYCKETNEKR